MSSRPDTSSARRDNTLFATHRAQKILESFRLAARSARWPGTCEMSAHPEGHDMNIELHPTITDAAEAIFRAGGLDDDAREQWTTRLVQASVPDRHDDFARQLFSLVAKHRRLFPDAADDVPMALCILAVSLLVEATKPAEMAKRATTIPTS